MRTQFISTCFLFTLASVLCGPISEELDIVLISEITIPLYNATTNQTQSLDKLRQDGDGDAAETAIGAIGEGEVGTNVANILQGVLGGGFENIFKGAAGFIGEEDTQAGVSTILASLAKPLNTIFASGIQSGAQYLGFGPTTPATLNATVATGAVPGAAEVSVTAAPVVAAAATTKDPEDDDDSDAEAKYRKQ